MLKSIRNQKNSGSETSGIIVIESEQDKILYEGQKLTLEDKLANEDLYKDFGGYEDR